MTSTQDTDGAETQTRDGNEDNPDWGFSSGSSKMAKETKIGLALILVLLGAFSFVAYKKMNEHNETLKEIVKTEKSEDDDDDSEKKSSTDKDDDVDSDSVVKKSGSDEKYPRTANRYGSPYSNDNDDDRQNEFDRQPFDQTQRGNSTGSGYGSDRNEFSSSDNSRYGSQQDQYGSDRTQYGSTTNEFDTANRGAGSASNEFDPANDFSQSTQQQQPTIYGSRDQIDSEFRSSSNSSTYGQSSRTDTGSDFNSQSQKEDDGFGFNDDDDRGFEQRRQETSTGSGSSYGQYRDAEDDLNNSFDSELTSSNDRMQQSQPGDDLGDPFGNESDTGGDTGYGSSTKTNEFSQNEYNSSQQTQTAGSSYRDTYNQDSYNQTKQYGSDTDDTGNEFDRTTADQNDRYGQYQPAQTEQSRYGSTSKTSRSGPNGFEVDDDDTYSSSRNGYSQSSQYSGNSDSGYSQSSQDTYSQSSDLTSQTAQRAGNDWNQGSYSARRDTYKTAGGGFDRSSSYSATSSVGNATAKIHVVQPNDNYWRISKQQYGTARYFTALARYNKRRIPDPQKMRPGMKVLVPDAEVLRKSYPDLFPGSKTSTQSGFTVSQPKQPSGFFINTVGEPAYRIGKAQTLSGIAQDHLGRSSRWIQIYELNRDRLKNPNDLKIGAVLRLPSDASSIQVVRQRSSVR